MLTIPEVAKQLRITRAYAYELARQGVLPAIRIGPKYVRVSEATLATWIEQQQMAQPVTTESRLPMPPLRFAVFQGPEKALIHSTTCGYCRRPGASGTWHRGPGKRGFESLEEARAAAKLLPVSAIEHTCITGRPFLRKRADR